MTFWPLTNSDFPTDQTFPRISWPWYQASPSPNYEWFPGSIKFYNIYSMTTGDAYPSGPLVPSLFWDLLVLKLLTLYLSKLPCLYSTFYIEYPSVLSWICFHVITDIKWNTTWFSICVGNLDTTMHKILINTDYLLFGGLFWRVTSL